MPAEFIYNAFELSDTFGVPLPVIVDEAAKRSARVSWLRFLADAAAAGWPRRTVIARLTEAYEDCESLAERTRLGRLISVIRERDLDYQ